MAQPRGAVVGWSGSVAGLALAAATLIATLGNKPLSNPWFYAMVIVAAIAAAILLAAGIPDLASWLSGSVPRARQPFHRPARLITNCWQYTSDGVRAPAAMSATEITLPGTGHMRQPGERPPWVRYVVLVACSPVSSGLEASEVRSCFMAFLKEPTVAALISALTYVAEDAVWEKWSTGRPSAFDAVLTPAGDAEAIASARLELPDGMSYHGRDGRYAALMLHVEPRQQDASPAPPAGPDIWAERILKVLEVPPALVALLSGTLGLSTPGEPPPQVAVRLEAPADITELIDIAGMESLPGGPRKSQAIGYFIADRNGTPAADAATRMVRHVLQYALKIEGWSPAPSQ